MHQLSRSFRVQPLRVKQRLVPACLAAAALLVSLPLQDFEAQRDESELVKQEAQLLLQTLTSHTDLIYSKQTRSAPALGSGRSDASGSASASGLQAALGGGGR